MLGKCIPLVRKKGGEQTSVHQHPSAEIHL